ncbi:helix-turn-helix domain-containing protein [Streptomyces marianii]|uniref:helix-turn-helix domain-containing protein n=1 Tax=Streptomyces marianii TaxID=1817406 RepID=UPI001F42B25A|nr:helix-turn-helix transcriptional regulator [Streptomyces marianii]
MMAARPVEIGEAGGRVASQVTALRQRRGWDQRALAQRVTDAGRPMSPSVLGKVETAARRVDVDDLVALAAALEVSPAVLLDEDERDPFADAHEASRRGSVRARVTEDIEALGDLEALDGMAPTLAAVAVRLATEIDAPVALPGTSLHSLAKELREVLKELRALAPEEPLHDDELGDDLASPD